METVGQADAWEVIGKRDVEERRLRTMLMVGR